MPSRWLAVAIVPCEHLAKALGTEVFQRLVVDRRQVFFAVGPAAFLGEQPRQVGTKRGVCAERITSSKGESGSSEQYDIPPLELAQEKLKFMRVGFDGRRISELASRQWRRTPRPL
jgi:hypothetical protein